MPDEIDDILNSLLTPKSVNSSWSLSEAGKVKDYFKQAFGHDLPVTNFGQGEIHNKWGLDHRNSMDISLNPNSSEGQALVSYLKQNGIPYLAFTHAVPGQSTGAHIHVGLPSHHTSEQFPIGVQPTAQDDTDLLLDDILTSKSDALPQVPGEDEYGGEVIRVNSKKTDNELPPVPGADVVRIPQTADEQSRDNEQQPNYLSVEMKLPEGFQNWTEVKGQDLAKWALQRQAERLGIPGDYAKKWVDERAAQGKLRLYDLKTKQDIEPIDIIGTPAYNDEKQTITLNEELPQLSELRSDYERDKGSDQQIREDWAAGKPAGQIAYDILAPPARVAATGLSYASRPLSAVSTTLNAALRAQPASVIFRPFGAKNAGDPRELARGLRAAWDELKGLDVPDEVRDNMLTQITDQQFGEALDQVNPHLRNFLKFGTGIFGDPLNLMVFPLGKAALASARAGKFGRRLEQVASALQNMGREGSFTGDVLMPHVPGEHWIRRPIPEPAEGILNPGETYDLFTGRVFKNGQPTPVQLVDGAKVYDPQPIHAETTTLREPASFGQGGKEGGIIGRGEEVDPYTDRVFRDGEPTSIKVVEGKRVYDSQIPEVSTKENINATNEGQFTKSSESEHQGTQTVGETATPSSSDNSVESGQVQQATEEGQVTTAPTNILTGEPAGRSDTELEALVNDVLAEHKSGGDEFGARLLPDARGVVRGAVEVGRGIYRAGMTVAEFGREMVRQLGESVRPYIDSIYRSLQGLKEDFGASVDKWRGDLENSTGEAYLKNPGERGALNIFGKKPPQGFTERYVVFNKKTGEPFKEFPTRKEAETALSSDEKFAKKHELRVIKPRELSPLQTTAVGKVINALKEIKPLREETESLYSVERGRRIQAFKGVMGEGGEREAQAALSQLKGELPKAGFEAVRPSLTTDEADALYKMIPQSNLDEWDKVTATSALRRLLDEHITLVPRRSELAILEKVYGGDFVKGILAKRSMGRRAWDEFMGATNLPRALIASYDISAPLRQGVILSVNHPIMASRAFKMQLHALVNEDYAQFVMDSIEKAPTAPLRKKAGLFLSDWRGFLSPHEELFTSKFAQMIPGVRASERAYSIYLNKLRTDVFDHYLNVFPGATPKDLENIATFINYATGRGSLGKFEAIAPELSLGFFSPRYTTSRFQVWGQPFRGTKMSRAIASRELVQFVGTGLGLLSLAALSAPYTGLKVEYDPRSSDFGKIRTGKTTIDLFGGMAQIARYITQISTGQVKNPKSGLITKLEDVGSSRLEVAGNFLRTKLSPQFGAVVNQLTGTDAVGNPYDIRQPVGNLKAGKTVADKLIIFSRSPVGNSFFPLGWRDLTEAVAQDRREGNFGVKGALIGSTSLVGAGVQTEDYPMGATDQRGVVKELYKRKRLGEDVSPDTSQARREGMITGRDIRTIRREGKQTDLQAQFDSLQIEAAIDAYTRLDTEGRSTVRRQLKMKWERAVRTLNPSDKLRLRQKYHAALSELPNVPVPPKDNVDAILDNMLK